MFDLLWKLLKKTLKRNDPDTLVIMTQRLAELQTKSFVPALLQIEESIHILEKHDIEKITTAQKKAKDDEIGNAQFRKAYHKKAFPWGVKPRTK